jgi:hypothetical protein
VADIHIPLGPIEQEPVTAIRADSGQMAAACLQALTAALDGLELGHYDRRIVSWLTVWEPSTVAVICSWVLRYREEER